MKHVRNEELLPFHKLTEEEQQILEGEVHKGNVERLDIHCREWYQNITRLYSFSTYRTISQEEQEMQHEENNEFPWQMVSSEWNAVARDMNQESLFLYKDEPLKGVVTWYGGAYVGYNPTAETQDETFTNTELKEYADLDDKTRQLLQNKHKEGKVELYCASVAWWYKKKDGDELLDKSVYRVV